MIKSFDELARLTKERAKAQFVPNVGVIWPMGGKCIEAASQAMEDGYLKTCLIGPRRDIEGGASQAGYDLCEFKIIDVDDLKAAVKTAADMVKSGELHFLLKGNIETRELVDILLRPEIGFMIGGQLLSHVGVMQTARYHKLIFMTDAAVNIAPDANDKIKIIMNAAAVARMLGNETPKAALLAAVETVNPAMPVTMEEAAIAKMSDRGQIKDVLIDGPLSFDVAINAEVARSKGITNSKVAGDPDIFVCPDLETANALYKAMVLYVKAETAGIIYGGIAPVSFAFAVDSVKNVSNSLILGACLTLGK